MLHHQISTHLSAATLRRENGSAMIFVLVIAVICNILIGSVLLSSRYSSKKSMNRREKISVINIAEAGKEHFYAKLLYEGYVPKKDSIEVVFNKVAFGNGCYTVVCSAGVNIDTMKIRVRGEEGNNHNTIEVLLTKKSDVDLARLNIRSKAAVVSKSEVDIVGNISIDGREYDSLNNLKGGGTFGIVTEKIVNLNGSAEVGGNTLAPVGKKDFPTYRAMVSKEGVKISDSLSSPEAFLQIPVGSLDKYKTDLSKLTIPFHGLVYFDGDTHIPDLGKSSGVIIVHNSTKSAELHLNGGEFKGLIICDVMNKVNGTGKILGSVVAIGDKTGSHFGNGTAEIHYSKDVLSNLEALCTNLHYKIEELSWRELVD